MAEYRIEVKLTGYAREYTRRLLYATARRYNIRSFSKNQTLPSMVLYGPFKTDDPQAVAACLAEVAGKYDLVPYRLKGFNHFEVEKKWLLFNQGMKGIYLDIEPSDTLRRLQEEIAEKLRPLTEPSDYFSGIGSFGAEVDFKDIEGRFGEVLAYLKDHEEKNVSQRLVKITLTKNWKTLCEYDFLQKKLVGKGHLAGSKYLRKTMHILRQTEEELKPVWTMASEIRKSMRRTRQTTLLDDDPALRLPKLLIPIGLRRGVKAQAANMSRQVTLVEDDPGKRVPKLLQLKIPKAKRAGIIGENTRQTTLRDGDMTRILGFNVPFAGRVQRFVADI